MCVVIELNPGALVRVGVAFGILDPGIVVVVLI